MMINRDSWALQIILYVATAFCTRGAAVLFIQKRARVILRVSKGVLLLRLLLLLLLCMASGHFIYLFFFLFHIAARCKFDMFVQRHMPLCAGKS